MLHYEGRRTNEGCEVVRADTNLEERALPLRLDLWNHSPTGFEWGYGGSGPAQLSLALLYDALGDAERAVRLHQAFKWEVISRLPKAGWQLLAEDVVAMAAALEQRQMEEQPVGAEEEPSEKTNALRNQEGYVR